MADQKAHNINTLRGIKGTDLGDGSVAIAVQPFNPPSGSSAQQVQGNAADGSAALGNPLQVAGKDGSGNIQSWLMETSGIGRVVLYSTGGSPINVSAIGNTDNQSASTLLIASSAFAERYNGTGWDRQRNNAEEVALASASDTAGGRVSADLVNYNARGIAILLNITARSGAAAFDAINVQAKLASGYDTIYTFGSLTIATTGQFAFCIYPGAASAGAWQSAPLQGIIPRNFRIDTDTTTDNVANNMTYSVTVVYIL